MVARTSVTLPHKLIKDICGQRYGRLVVLSYSHSTGTGHTYWLCRCDCGTEKLVRKNGIEKRFSCGCYKREIVSVLARRTCQTHGMSGTRLERIFAGMFSRCYRQNSRNYHCYGGRGIRIDESWRSDRSTFYRWALDNGYAENLELDRIDNNQGYGPGNCRWTSHKENLNNFRRNRHLEYGGKRLSLAEWAEETGLSRDLISGRYHRGWAVEEILGYRKRER